MDAAHTRGLVHRDVKPANILLAVEDGVVAHAWLADFGLTRRIGGARGLTVSGQVLGTIDYVAPEQVEGGPVDGRADQYALGGVLFECLTGEVPFRRDGELAVLWAHVHDPPPQLSDHRPELPAALDDAIGRALAKAPGDRYPSCEALVPTAQAALTGTALAPAGARHRVRGPAGRRAGPGRRRPWLTRRSSLVLTITAGVLSAVLPAANHAVRIDQATNRVQEIMPASGSGPDRQGGPGLAYASGSLWVANTAQRRVTRTEPGADPTPIPVEGASPIAIVAAQDAVWVAARTQRGRGLLARIDAGANQASPAVPLPHPPTGLAITPDGGTIWVATAADQTIRRIDTRNGAIRRRIALTLAPAQAAFGDGVVWVTSTTGDAVLRIDATTSKVEATIRVGNGPTGIAFGADRVWVANSQDGTVSTIDPQTNAVGTLRLGFRPTAVAVIERAVWVALAA